MKNAMVWGGDGDIGRAIAACLAADGWEILVTTRDGSSVDNHSTAEVDVADEFAVQQAVLQAGSELGPVNFWIYAVGDIEKNTAAEQGLADRERILTANLTGAFSALHHSLPLLADDAHIAFIGAVSERLQLPGLGAYAAAKAGLEAFAAALRKEQRGRRVTVVRPGAVNTKFWKKVPLGMPKGAVEADAVAAALLSAYENDHSGHLDEIPKQK